MQISGYSPLFGTQETEESERVRRARSGADGSAISSFGGEDTVTISDEGRRLAEEMRLRKIQEEEDQERRMAKAQDGSSAPVGEGAEGAPETGAAGGGGGSSSSSSSSVEDIKKQIQQLEAKLASTASSSLPENVKQSAMATYQAQIQELESQLRSMAGQG